MSNSASRICGEIRATARSAARSEQRYPVSVVGRENPAMSSHRRPRGRFALALAPPSPDTLSMAMFSPAPRLVAVLGPTNTGKTHLAIERMLGHKSGMIGFPLRLLARENYDRIVKLQRRARGGADHRRREDPAAQPVLFRLHRRIDAARSAGRFPRRRRDPALRRPRARPRLYRPPAARARSRRRRCFSAPTRSSR